jgi:hypothetical protein
MRHRAVRDVQPFERLRARDFVQQLTVDVEQCRAVVFGVDDVGIPQFVVESLCHGYAGS